MQARGAPRSNATAKDSEWVRTRQALEKDKPDDVNEVDPCLAFSIVKQACIAACKDGAHLVPV